MRKDRGNIWSNGFPEKKQTLNTTAAAAAAGLFHQAARGHQVQGMMVHSIRFQTEISEISSSIERNVERLAS
jgi:hypothetical protein